MNHRAQVSQNFEKEGLKSHYLFELIRLEDTTGSQICHGNFVISCFFKMAAFQLLLKEFVE